MRPLEVLVAPVISQPTGPTRKRQILPVFGLATSMASLPKH